MLNSLEIPQDIIDNIIETVDDDDGLLKKCALVSSSFLLPSRKRLFSRLYLRSDKACQRLQQFFAENPAILPFVRSITVDFGTFPYGGFTVFPFHRSNTASLIAILQLSFCCLESFSLDTWKPSRIVLDDLSGPLKDALYAIIRSSTLKTVRIRRIEVPIRLFQGVHLTKLQFDWASSEPLTRPASDEVVEIAIDQLVWITRWELGRIVYVPTEPVFIPLMCRLRVFEIDYDPSSAKIGDLRTSFMIQSLLLSLTSPPTLEHLKVGITFTGKRNYFDSRSFHEHLRDADLWRHVDSIVTHPSGSRLQRVDIDIKYTFLADDGILEPDGTEAEEPILDALPLLRKKGILFVEANVNG